MDRSGRDGLGRRTATGRGGTALDRRGESMGHDGDGRGVPGRGHGADLPSGGCGPRAGRGAGLREDRPGPTPVTTPSAARTGTWRSSAPPLPAGRGPSDPQPAGRGPIWSKTSTGSSTAGAGTTAASSCQAWAALAVRRGTSARRCAMKVPSGVPANRSGTRAGPSWPGRAPVSSSMRTTPTAYRSWAGSGSAPYLASGDTWSGAPITWVTRASRGSASWQLGSRDKKTGHPREPGLRDGRRRAGVREDDVRRAARAQQDVGGLPSRWTSPAE